MTDYQIKASWDSYRPGESLLTISKSFEDLANIEKLDFLQDVIGELSQKYQDILDTWELSGNYKKGEKK